MRYIMGDSWNINGYQTWQAGKSTTKVNWYVNRKVIYQSMKVFFISTFDCLRVRFLGDMKLGEGGKGTPSHIFKTYWGRQQHVGNMNRQR